MPLVTPKRLVGVGLLFAALAFAVLLGLLTNPIAGAGLFVGLALGIRALMNASGPIATRGDAQEFMEVYYSGPLATADRPNLDELDNYTIFIGRKIRGASALIKNMVDQEACTRAEADKWILGLAEWADRFDPVETKKEA
jgi:hypothetical protein